MEKDTITITLKSGERKVHESCSWTNLTGGGVRVNGTEYQGEDIDRIEVKKGSPRPVTERLDESSR